jgi:AcrR family transcriptional regulator
MTDTAEAAGVLGTADQRREQMLRAALEVIAERGYADTRIADVAERTGISPALVIYYFKTKDQLLTEAIRYLENVWYADGQRRMAELPTDAARIEEIVAMSCLPEADAEPRSSWTLWLDFWALAARNPGVGALRRKDGRVPGGGPGQLRDPALRAAGRAGHPDRPRRPRGQLTTGVRGVHAVHI